MLGVSSAAFRADVYDRKRLTLKFWIYVNDMTLMEGDKGLPDHGTIYVRVSSEGGDDAAEHGWNHTIEGAGWQEVELSFTCNNTYYAILKACDYRHLNYFRLFCYGRTGLEVRLDDLRLVEYRAGYTQPPAPFGGHWISTCDCTALDGVLLTEFFGASFDPGCKTGGSTSLRTREPPLMATIDCMSAAVASGCITKRMCFAFRCVWRILSGCARSLSS